MQRWEDFFYINSKVVAWTVRTKFEIYVNNTLKLLVTLPESATFQWQILLYWWRLKKQQLFEDYCVNECEKREFLWNLAKLFENCFPHP